MLVELWIDVVTSRTRSAGTICSAGWKTFMWLTAWRTRSHCD